MSEPNVKKLIIGNENFSNILQRPMMHAIFREFIINMKSNPNGDEYRMLHDAVSEMRNSMQYPYGRIEMARKNLYNEDPDKAFYAVKELENLPKIIQAEDYINRTLVLDQNFKFEWTAAKSAITTFLTEIKVFAINAELQLTAGTFNRFIKVRGREYSSETAKMCLMKLRQAWQQVWHSYTEISEIINYRGNNKFIIIKNNRNP